MQKERLACAVDLQRCPELWTSSLTLKCKPWWDALQCLLFDLWFWSLPRCTGNVSSLQQSGLAFSHSRSVVLSLTICKWLYVKWKLMLMSWLAGSLSCWSLAFEGVEQCQCYSVGALACCGAVNLAAPPDEDVGQHSDTAAGCPRCFVLGQSHGSCGVRAVLVFRLFLAVVDELCVSERMSSCSKL